jgi:hypothetical protein
VVKAVVAILPEEVQVTEKPEAHDESNGHHHDVILRNCEEEVEILDDVHLIRWDENAAGENAQVVTTALQILAFRKI